MLIDRHNLAKHAAWIIVFAATTLAALVWYFGYAYAMNRYPGGSTLPGLVFGIAGGILILFEFLLWPRKHFRRLRLGRMQTWMRAHIWLGLLTVPMIVLHGGWWGRSILVNVMMALFWLVIASGVFGLAMQQVLPKMMLHFLPAETVHSQIDYVAALYASEAESLVAMLCGGSPEDDLSAPADTPAAATASRAPAQKSHVVIGAHRTVGSVGGKTVQTVIRQEPVRNAELLRNVLHQTVRPFLLQGNEGCPKLTDRIRSKAYFDNLRLNFEDSTVLRAVNSMEEWCEHRRQFDLQSRLHWWLHGWLSIHLPLSVALVVLMFVHVVLALKYS